MSDIQTCFICRFPTTDWVEHHQTGEPMCGSCFFDDSQFSEEDWVPSPEEQIAVYQMLEHKWTPEDLEEFSQEFQNK